MAGKRYVATEKKTSRIFAFYSGLIINSDFDVILFPFREFARGTHFQFSCGGWIDRSMRFFVIHICIGLIYKLILTQTL